MAPVPPPALDHVIILIPHAKLRSLPAWIPAHFAVTPGGRHSDGRTENRLVCLADGSYFEFIAFVGDDEGGRVGHKWGACKYGIIDFALTHSPSDSSAEANYIAVNDRLSKSGSEARYEEPLEGGRIRDDGQEIKWTVTVSSLQGTGVRQGELPFFCHDVTARTLRVPDAEENTKHPSGAYGVKSLGLYVPRERVQVLASAYEAILGTPPRTEGGRGDGVGWEIRRLRDVGGVEKGVEFVIRAAGEQDGLGDVEERGGVLLSDLVVGGRHHSVTRKGKRVRIDVPVEDGVGGLFLELEVPVTAEVKM